MKLPSQRKLLLGTKGCDAGTRRLHPAVEMGGDLWSKGEMRDPQKGIFALHLGFTFQVPKLGSVEPLVRTTLRQGRRLCCLACIGAYSPFLHHLIFGM